MGPFSPEIAEMGFRRGDARLGDLMEKNPTRSSFGIRARPILKTARTLSDIATMRSTSCIEQLRVTMKPEEQQKLFYKIFRLIQADQPYTFLFSEKRTALYDSRLENIKFYRVRPCVDSREWYSDRPRIFSD